MIKKIVFAGNNQIAVDILKFLRSQPVNIVGLIIHPRGLSKKRRDLIQISGLPSAKIFTGDRLQNQQVINALSALKPDLLLSINFRYILKPNIIQIPKFGCINLHFGYLPYNRGVFADAWSIIDDTPAGVTYHLIDPGIDTGKIVAQQMVEKNATDTGKSLYQKLTKAAYELFVTIWPSISRWNFSPKNQPDEGTSHKRVDINAIDHIDPEKKYKAKDLINILRARTFPPYDGAYVITKDGQKIYLRIELYKRTTPQHTIRLATPEDSDDVRAIRNTPDVRIQSNDSSIITRGDHNAWYLRRVNQTDCPFLVAVRNNTVVGYIRLDKERAISIAVKKDCRNLGIGSTLLTKLLGMIDIHPITAVVKKTNVYSVQFFQKHGFTLDKQNGGYQYLMYRKHRQHIS